MVAPPSKAVTLTPGFKLIFITVLGLTILSFLGMVVLVILKDNPSESAQGAIETAATTYKIGFGALAGLIGGKFA